MDSGFVAVAVCCMDSGIVAVARCSCKDYNGSQVSMTHRLVAVTRGPRKCVVAMLHSTFSITESVVRVEMT